MRRSATWALLLCLAGCGEATARPGGRCQIQGVVTLDGKPAVAKITAVRYAGLHEMPRWTARMPGHTDAAVEDLIARARTTSDPHGRYVLPGLPAGIYAVTAQHTDGRVADAVVVLHADGMIGGKELALAEARVIQGRLVWADGTPVQGNASITHGRSRPRMANGPFNPWWSAYDSMPDGPTQAVALEPDGTFRVADVPARYSILRVDLGEGLTWHGYVGAHNSKPIPPLVRPTLTLDGRVRTPSGQPVADATVTLLFPPFQCVVRTDASGDFRARVLKDKGCTARVEVAGFATSTTPVTSPKPVITLATPTPSLVGRVVQTNGAPASGARVVVLDPSPHSIALAPFRTAEADTDGRFQFDDLPFEPTLAFVRGGGWVTPGMNEASFRKGGELQIARGTEPWKLVVERSTTLRGRVVDTEGQPLRGMQVRALGTTPARRAELSDAACGPTVVTTQEDGSFTISDAVPGWMYEIHVTRPDLPDVSVGPFPAGAEVPVEFVVPQAHWLDVQVIDATNHKPIENAWVHVSPPTRRWLPRSRLATRSSAQGWARFGPMVPGALTVHSTHPGYVRFDGTARGTATTDRDNPGQTVVRLIRALTISGTVQLTPGVDPRTVGVTARRIEGDQLKFGGSASLDEDGHFEIGGLLHGRYRLWVRSWSTRLCEDLETVAGDTNVQIKLDDSQWDALRVEVVDPQGKPVPRARVLVVSGHRSQDNLVQGGAATIRIDPKYLEGDGPVEVFVTGAQDDKEKPLALGSVLHPPVARTAGPVRIQLGAAHRIEGRVLNEDGKPVPGVQVLGSPVGGPANRILYGSSAHTDETGSFTLTQLGPGRHRIASMGHIDYLYARPVETDVGAKDVRIILTRGLQAVVTILDGDGQAVEKAYVRALANEQNFASARGKSAADGTVRLEGLHKGVKFSLEVFPPESRPDLGPWKIPVWSPADLTVRLYSAFSIAGEVRDAAGKLVPHATVRLESTQHGVEAYVHATDGRFRWKGCRGPTTLRATWPTKGDLAKASWDSSAVVVERETLDVVLTMPER